MLEPKVLIVYTWNIRLIFNDPLRRSKSKSHYFFEKEYNKDKFTLYNRIFPIRCVC